LPVSDSRLSPASSGAAVFLSGIREKNAAPAPVKIVQTPDLVVFLYESRTIFRQIFTDGRSLPPPDAQPTLQGFCRTTS
jgi:hypothetical protein